MSIPGAFKAYADNALDIAKRRPTTVASVAIGADVLFFGGICHITLGTLALCGAGTVAVAPLARQAKDCIADRLKNG